MIGFSCQGEIGDFYKKISKYMCIQIYVCVAVYTILNLHFIGIYKSS